MKPSLLWKELVLGVVFVVVSFFTFYAWREVIRLLVDGRYQIPLLVGAGVGLVIISVLFCLLSIFAHDLRLRSVFVGVGIASPFLFVPLSLPIVLLLAVSVLFALFSASRLRKEYDLSATFHLSRILRAGLSIFLSVVAIIVSTYYFADFNEVRSLSTLIPKPLVNATAGRLSGFVGIPNYDADQRVDDFLVDYVTKRLADRNLPVSAIPKAEFRQLIADQRADFAKQMGFPLTGNERVGDVLYIALTAKMHLILEPIQQYVPFITAAAFFLGFKTVMLPLYYVTFLILYLVIELLTAVGFFRKEIREIQVEKLTL